MYYDILYVLGLNKKQKEALPFHIFGEILRLGRSQVGLEIGPEQTNEDPFCACVYVCVCACMPVSISN